MWSQPSPQTRYSHEPPPQTHPIPHHQATHYTQVLIQAYRHEVATLPYTPELLTLARAQLGDTPLALAPVNPGPSSAFIASLLQTPGP